MHWTPHGHSACNRRPPKPAHRLPLPAVSEAVRPSSNPLVWPPAPLALLHSPVGMKARVPEPEPPPPQPSSRLRRFLPPEAELPPPTRVASTARAAAWPCARDAAGHRSLHPVRDRPRRRGEYRRRSSEPGGPPSAPLSSGLESAHAGRTERSGSYDPCGVRWPTPSAPGPGADSGSPCASVRSAACWPSPDSPDTPPDQLAA